MGRGHRNEFGFIWRLTILASYFLHGSLGQVSALEVPSAFHGYRDVLYGAPKGCPIEHYGEIRPITQGADGQNNISYDVGQEVTSECYSEDINIQLRQAKYPAEFIVYPMPKRSCQSNGTWSSVPPACIHNNLAAVQRNERNYVPIEMKLCSNKDACLKEREYWQPIGRLHPSCSPNKGHSRSDYEHFHVYVEFARHVHLSYMTFVLADDDGRITRPFDVEVSVHPDDVIPELSPESKNFLRDHYHFYSKQKAVNECAVIEMATYTKSLLLRFSVELKQKTANLRDEPLYKRWKPRPMFYPIQELHIERKLAWYGLGCPEAPVIPNASITKPMKENDKTVTYACQPGYVMLDPTTNKPSNGKIECINSFEWSPYPLPICVPKTNNAKQNVDLPEVEEDLITEETAPGMESGAKSLRKMNQGALYARKDVPGSPTVNSKELDPVGQESEIVKTTSSNSGSDLKMAYIITGIVLAVIGLTFGFVIVFVCAKGKKLMFLPNDNKGQGEVGRPELYFSRGGFKHKENRLSATYTIISEVDSLDSQISGHIYEHIIHNIAKSVAQK